MKIKSNKKSIDITEIIKLEDYTKILIFAVWSKCKIEGDECNYKLKILGTLNQRRNFITYCNKRWNEI